MIFKKTLSVLLAVSLFSVVNAIGDKGIKVLNKIMDEGVIVNKVIDTNDKDISLIIYKGLVVSDAAYALLKMTNNKDKEIVVNEYVGDGIAIKDRLSGGESTYIVVEELKMQNSHNLLKSNKVKENKIGKWIKNSDFKKISKSIESIFNIYYIDVQEELNHLPKFKLEQYFNNIELFDHYSFVELDIQKGLYKGIFVNGYETLKSGGITPKTYYFVVDNLTGDISYMYIINKKISYKELSNSVKGKK